MTAQTEFPWCISRRKILGSFILTAKMASLSIDHRWSKFKGKDCKELIVYDMTYNWQFHSWGTEYIYVTECIVYMFRAMTL